MGMAELQLELLVPSHLPVYTPHLGWSGTPLSHSSNCFLKYSVGLSLISLIRPGMQLNSLSIFLIGLLNIFVCNPSTSIFLPSSTCHAYMIIYLSLLRSML